MSLGDEIIPSVISPETENSDYSSTSHEYLTNIKLLSK